MKNMMKIKERQKYLKKLGLYKGKIDGIEGSGTKKGYEYINIIFLNVSNDNYTSKTDSKLKTAYNSYKKSKYMTSADWKLFPNFKESDFKCKKKYCDGFNGRKNKCYMKLIMFAQYIRNYYDKPVYISSGVRCKKRNAQVGGVKTSKHLVFKAMDFKVGNLKANEVFKVVKKMITSFLKVKNPTKQMFKDLISKITIDKDKKVKIYFKFNLIGE